MRAKRSLKMTRNTLSCLNGNKRLGAVSESSSVMQQETSASKKKNGKNQPFCTFPLLMGKKSFGLFPSPFAASEVQAGGCRLDIPGPPVSLQPREPG